MRVVNWGSDVWSVGRRRLAGSPATCRPQAQVNFHLVLVLGVVAARVGAGRIMAYMLIAKPYDKSEGVPEGDAVEVAAPNYGTSASSHPPVEHVR
jgi:hypothetical protein